MKSQDGVRFDFTRRWVDQHLPYEISISTEDLYIDFIDCLIDQNRKDMPTKSAFLSRLGKMDFACSQYEMIENRKGRMVRSKTWFKVEVIAEPEPCIFSKYHDKAMQLLAAGKERVTWFR